MRCALFSRFESIANCLISVHPCLFYSKTQMESKAFLWFNDDIKSFFSSITALSSGDVSVIKTSHPLGKILSSFTNPDVKLQHFDE